MQPEIPEIQLEHQEEKKGMSLALKDSHQFSTSGVSADLDLNLFRIKSVDEETELEQIEGSEFF